MLVNQQAIALGVIGRLLSNPSGWIAGLRVGLAQALEIGGGDDVGLDFDAPRSAYLLSPTAN
ncbi:MAG: hypothetical protein EA367_19500 [Leptolyngbya sp. DLM2.Bin15]|nr:MAG: hypothetical protein EA367_19500 [Leptolyngbya sp. DLM2.Bin15]